MISYQEKSKANNYFSRFRFRKPVRFKIITVSLLFLYNISFAEMKSSITQYGISWIFDNNYETGTFANGDFWVVGPVTITGITPDFDCTGAFKSTSPFAQSEFAYPQSSNTGQSNIFIGYEKCENIRFGGQIGKCKKCNCQQYLHIANG